jgi:DNA-binding NarL/FixJ family response regulator
MEESDMRVAGEAGSVEELLPLLEKQCWSILVLDINMPGRSGLDALKDIKALYPDLAVLILSMYGEDQYGIRAIRAGAAGYLKKISAPNELVIAIRKIVGGGRYISPELAGKIADAFAGPGHGKAEKDLSDREYEIMCKIALGRTMEEISEELSLSIHTVYSYRNRIISKMNFKSNIELTRYVLQNKLLDE